MEINSFEYAAEQKIEGKLKQRRNLLLLLYVVFTALLFGVIFYIKMITFSTVKLTFIKKSCTMKENKTKSEKIYEKRKLSAG